MRAKLRRRTFLAGTAAAAALPMPAIAQNKPIRIGLLTVKTGPLAQGGIQMEQGVNLFLKDRDNMLAGRKVELLVGDTGGNPAGTKTKAQELIERDNVDMIFGPLAAFELLAISDYVAAHKTPILSLAAAEDMSQRKPNPYFVRASGTSAQNTHVLADYAAKELKYKTVITVSEDFAYGYEQMGGFQRVFEGAGGHVVKKLWPPIVTPDYTPYIAQLSGVDAVVQGFAGSNPLKFMKQYKDAGVTLPVIGGGTAGDDALLKSFGDEAIGLVTASVFTSDLDTPVNKQFIAGMVRDTGAIPGLYAAGLYINGMVAEAALKATDGNTERQGCVHEGAACRVAARTRRADRSTSTISATSSATSTSAAWRKRTASWCRPRSRPTRTSASSGPSTRSGSWSSRSIRATIRSLRPESKPSRPT